MLGGDQPPLQISRQPVRFVGLVLGQGHALPRRVFHPPGGLDVVKEEVLAFRPPHRPFGGTDVAAETTGQFADLLVGVDDVAEFRRHLFDAFGALRRSAPVARGKGDSGRSTRQHDLPPRNPVMSTHGEFPPL